MPGTRRSLFPQFKAHTVLNLLTGVRSWLAKTEVGTLYIEPGSPWENPYSESFNSRLRDELLDREVLATLAEAKVMMDHS